MNDQSRIAHVEVSLEHIRFGPESRNRLAEASSPGPEGAIAALETFYYALNGRDAQTLTAVWLDEELVQLNNPVGGIVRGREPIAALYRRIVDGPVRIEVTFEDVVRYAYRDVIVFAGRERGRYEHNGVDAPLAIRTTRVFAFSGEAWRQVHHHGSIDDPGELSRYQDAILHGQTASS